MLTEIGEPMSDNQMCLRHDEVADIESRLSVGDYLVCGDQRQRVAEIFYLSTHGAITVVLADGGKIGWKRLKEMVLNTGKGKVVRG